MISNLTCVVVLLITCAAPCRCARVLLIAHNCILNCSCPMFRICTVSLLFSYVLDGDAQF